MIYVRINSGNGHLAGRKEKFKMTTGNNTAVCVV